MTNFTFDPNDFGFHGVSTPAHMERVRRSPEVMAVRVANLVENQQIGEQAYKNVLQEYVQEQPQAFKYDSHESEAATKIGQRILEVTDRSQRQPGESMEQYAIRNQQEYLKQVEEQEKRNAVPDGYYEEVVKQQLSTMGLGDYAASGQYDTKPHWAEQKEDNEE